MAVYIYQAWRLYAAIQNVYINVTAQLVIGLTIFKTYFFMQTIFMTLTWDIVCVVDIVVETHLLLYLK